MTGKRPRNVRFEALGDVLERVIPQCRPNLDPALLGVWKVWDAVVGVQVAANARPAAFKGSILLVHVGNSTWLHHLRFSERDIIERLNLALGGERVHVIKWKIGPI